MVNHNEVEKVFIGYGKLEQGFSCHKQESIWIIFQDKLRENNKSMIDLE